MEIAHIISMALSDGDTIKWILHRVKNESACYDWFPGTQFALGFRSIWRSIGSTTVILDNRFACCEIYEANPKYYINNPSRLIKTEVGSGGVEAAHKKQRSHTIRLSISPSQGDDPGFKSRPEHSCFVGLNTVWGYFWILYSILFMNYSILFLKVCWIMNIASHTVETYFLKWLLRTHSNIGRIKTFMTKLASSQLITIKRLLFDLYVNEFLPENNLN